MKVVRPHAPDDLRIHMEPIPSDENNKRNYAGTIFIII
jgi:hypothetical protein